MLSIQYLQAYAPNSAILRLLNKASSQEKAAAQDSTNLSNTIASNMNTTFANSQQTQGGLNAQLQRITNAGISGQGFTPGEEANERSQSKEAEAQQDVQAEQALNERNQGQPGTSGAVGAENAMLASNAAANDANTQRNITAKNADLARANLTTGLQGLGNLSGQQTAQADALADAAPKAQTNSFTEETQANEPFWGNLGENLLSQGLGAATNVGLGLATGGLSTLASGIGHTSDSDADEEISQL